MTDILPMEPGCIIEVDWGTVNREDGTVEIVKDGKRYTTLIKTVLEKSEPTAGGYPKA
jgi:hypothetical protein